MIVDSHMHVGDFPMFNASMDQDTLIVESRAYHIVLGRDDIIGINTVIDVAEREPNVYPETPGMPMHSQIRTAVERVGPDRVLHGSDTPFHHPSGEPAKVRVSALSTDLTDRFLGGNGRRLFFSEGTFKVVA